MKLADDRRFGWWLGGLLLVSVLLRLSYVAVQSRTDPWFVHPGGGDPADTLAWAASLAGGEGSPPGAYYGAPLYPFLLAGFLRLFGLNFGLLYYLQQLALVGAAGAMALAARRLTGDPVTGLATALLVVGYGPNLFFPSRPVAEPVAMLSLALGMWALTGRSRWGPAVAGLLVGAAAVARPTLLPIGPLWSLGAWRGSGGARAALLLAGFALALLPTAVRNHRESGHLVPVAANAGMTFYHGNGPGATGYIVVPPELAQAGKGDQRRIATRVASERSGRPLDDVEADRWWAAQARAERLAHPGATVRLLGRRLALALSNVELALDMGPRQDSNPLRWAAPLPLAAILGLAAAGLTIVGWRATGGPVVWSAVGACAVTPLLFYVTSRYRLPMATMLCLPAGAGLAALLRPSHGWARRMAGLAVAGVVATVSLAVPGRELLEVSDAGGLRQRARAWRQVGAFDRAEADLRDSLARSESAPAWHQLGEVLESSGRPAEAEACYRRALQARPPYAPAACQLGQFLRLAGRDAEAVPVLRQGVESHALLVPCWNHLVAALTAQGALDEAASEAARASGLGLELDPAVLTMLRAAREAATAPRGEWLEEGD